MTGNKRRSNGWTLGIVSVAMLVGEEA